MKLLSKGEEVALHKAVNAGCPFHNGTGRICLHMTLGKLIGVAIAERGFHPTVLPEDVVLRA